MSSFTRRGCACDKCACDKCACDKCEKSEGVTRMQVWVQGYVEEFARQIQKHHPVIHSESLIGQMECDKWSVTNGV